MKPRFIRLSYFTWLILPAAIFATYLTIGLPHFPWSYTFANNGDPYNPFAERYYYTCTFWGPYGMHTVNAHNGRCRWVQFFKDHG